MISMGSLPLARPMVTLRWVWWVGVVCTRVKCILLQLLLSLYYTICLSVVFAGMCLQCTS